MPENSSQAVNLALYPYSNEGGNNNNNNGLGLHRRASPSSLPPDPQATCLASSHRGVYSSSSAGICIGPISLDPGTYLLLPSTFEPWVGKFRLVLYTSPVEANVTQIQ
jgi:hypothetical protein